MRGSRPYTSPLLSRYDKTSDSYLGFANVSSLRLWHHYSASRPRVKGGWVKGSPSFGREGRIGEAWCAAGWPA
jgi:hypothetical protein